MYGVTFTCQMLMMMILANTEFLHIAKHLPYLNLLNSHNQYFKRCKIFNTILQMRKMLGIGRAGICTDTI